MKTLRNEIELVTTSRSEQKQGGNGWDFWARLDLNQTLFYFQMVSTNMVIVRPPGHCGTTGLPFGIKPHISVV